MSPLSRRNLLAGVVTLPAVAVPAILPSPAAPAGRSSAIDKAITDWQAAFLRANAAWQELQALPGDARHKLPRTVGLPAGLGGRYWDERELLNAADETRKGALVADAMGREQQVPVPEVEDPILALIADYRAGIAAYNADPYVFGVGERDDALVAQTYGPPLEALRNAPPARTLKGAIEAVRFAKAEAELFMGDETIVAMLTSALAYFDSREGGAA